MATTRMSDDVRKSLAPLFERARRDGLWFYSRYAGTWFSPEELEATQAEGRFRWGAVNWELRDPEERADELARKAAGAAQELEAFRVKFANWLASRRCPGR